MPPEEWETTPEADPAASQPTRLSSGRDSPPQPPSPPPTTESGPTRGPVFDPQAPAEGQWLVNRYQLRAHLGQGGMGMVWRAWDEELERDVAIKLLPPEITQDVRAQRQLKIEAQAAIALAHPNIVKVLSFRRAAASQFLEMEFVNGPSLADVLHKNGPLPEAQVQRHLIDVCAGLAEAHRRGIIHRDIKPANLLLDPDGTIKIADFGIARIVAESTTRATGTVASGTLLYMAPEQLLGKPCDARSDIYSLGVMAYELLAGEVPFNSGDITYQALHERPAPIYQTAPILWPVIERMLEKKPEDRFQDTWSLADILGGGGTGPRVAYPQSVPSISTAATRDAGKTAVVGAPSNQRAETPTQSLSRGEAATVAASDPVAASRPAGPARRSPWLLALGGLGALAAIAILAVVFMFPPSVRPEAAADAKTRAGDAMTLAGGVDAKKLARDSWGQGVDAMDLGQKLEDSGDFEGAVKHYGNAERHFDNAGKATVRAQGLQEGALEAQKEMQASLQTATDLQAPQLGGSDWQTAEGLRGDAEAALTSQQWETAQAKFNQAQAAYAQAAEHSKLLTSEKALADAARSRQVTARAAAEQAGASTHAATLWATAEDMTAEAQTAFGAGDFAGAQASYTVAVSEYTAAKEKAATAQANQRDWLAKVQTAKAAGEKAKQGAAAVDAAKFAPATWSSAERLAADATAKQSGGSFEVALNLYAEAQKLYAAAALEAQTNAATAQQGQIIVDAAKNMEDAAKRVAVAKQKAIAANGQTLAPIAWVAATADEQAAMRTAEIAARVNDAKVYADAATYYGEARKKYEDVVRKTETVTATFDRAVTAAKAALADNKPDVALKQLSAALKTGIETPALASLRTRAEAQQQGQRTYHREMANATGLASNDPRRALQALALAEKGWPGQPDAKQLRNTLAAREQSYRQRLDKARGALENKDWKAGLAAVEAANTAWPPETSIAKSLREKAEELRWQAGRAQQNPDYQGDRAPTGKKKKSKKKGGFDYLGDR